MAGRINVQVVFNPEGTDIEGVSLKVSGQWSGKILELGAAAQELIDRKVAQAFPDAERYKKAAAEAKAELDKRLAQAAEREEKARAVSQPSLPTPEPSKPIKPIKPIKSSKHGK